MNEDGRREFERTDLRLERREAEDVGVDFLGGERRILDGRDGDATRWRRKTVFRRLGSRRRRDFPAFGGVEVVMVAV